MKTQIMNLFRMMEKSLKMGKSLKCLKSLMQIFATYATYASAIFVGKESNESTVRYALWSRISLIKPLQNPYLTLTRFRLSLGSNLSRFSLASLICLCMLTVGVGDAWGDIDLRGKTSALTIPLANSESSYTKGDWRTIGAPSSTGNATCTITQSAVTYGTITLTSVTDAKADESGGYPLQFTAGSGSVSFVIKSDYGVDVVVRCKSKNSEEMTLNLTGASQQYAGTSWGTKTLSTTNTSATLSLASKSGASKACGITYIKITPKTASTKTFTLMLPKGDGTYDEYETTDADDLADPDVASLGADCGGEDLNGYFAYKWTTSAIARASASTYDLSDISPKYDDDNPPSTSATLYPLFYDGESGLLHTAPVCVVPCANSVSIAKGTESNCEISFSSASVSTCTGTRQVTVSVTPSTCYAAPVKESVTSTGTTATWVSGPTQNGSAYDYVYGFAENATGTATFSCSLTTKTTYTVSYAAGNTTCTGGNAITGSKANDTKTCGTNLTLPGETFHTTGYTQTGWTKTPCGSQTNGLGGTYSSNAAQTFYPVWSINSYSVTWKVNNTNYSAGGSSSVTHGNHIATLPSAPNPPTYGCGDVFVGWTDVQNYVHGTSPLYTTADDFPNATGDQVFYAVYADYTTE